MTSLRSHYRYAVAVEGAFLLIAFIFFILQAWILGLFMAFGGMFAGRVAARIHSKMVSNDQTHASTPPQR